MRDVVRVPLAAAILVCGSVSTSAQATNADEKGECIRASDQGQQLRDDGKYRLAREAFVRCARTSCPALVSHDCQEWLVDVDAHAPTVVIDAKDDKGNDLAEVTVRVDGAPLVANLTGLPTRVDPGEHVFRYEAAGLAPIEERVVVRTGEKNRVLRVRFGADQATAAVPPATAIAPATVEPPRAKRPPVATWVFAGTALAAFASEAYFGIAGLDQRSGDLSGSGKCAPQCSSSEKASIQTKFIAADISLGIGVVSAGLAVFLFLRSREHRAVPEAAVDFTPRSGGGLATVTGHF
jgi:hypothetical protein